MDQFVVDLGPGPVDVTEGDDAVLFGPGDDGEPTTQDWATTLGTINYEVVTSPAAGCRGCTSTSRAEIVEPQAKRSVVGRRRQGSRRSADWPVPPWRGL